jgi:alanine racemase
MPAHPAWIEVDCNQLKSNIALIKNHIGNSLLCLVVKANAYGHGLCSIGKMAQDAGVDYLGVAHLQEGVELRQSGIDIPILVLGAIHEDQILDFIHFNLEFTISSSFKANLVANVCEKNQRKCRVHLEIDTGMQRTGVRPSTASSLLEQVRRHRCFTIAGIYSHLATADHPDNPFALEQIHAFKQLIRNLQLDSGTPVVLHIANSSGTVFFPQAHLDMVRTSLIAFGYPPDNAPSSWSSLSPCLSLKAKISYFKVVAQGEGISYGHTYRTKQQTRIVTVPVGYGDGYRRCLSNRGCVLIRGRRFPIVGTICMDQFMVDIGDQEAYVGDEVVLIGKQGSECISLMEIAALCDTIPYEILCGFNQRIPRFYFPKAAMRILEEEPPIIVQP